MRDSTRQDAIGIVSKFNTMITIDYSKFLHIHGNRDVNPAHVERLAKSFKKTNGNLTPALINKDYGILDGQHSLEASILAKTPFKYEIYDGDLTDEEVMIEMNIFSKNWNTEEFARHHASLNRGNYPELISIFDNNNISFVTLLTFCNMNKGNIERADTVLIPHDILYQIYILEEISLRFKSKTGNKPRQDMTVWAMKNVEVELRRRESRGDTGSRVLWSYDRVIKNLPHVLNEFGVSDNGKAIFGKLSEANDYQRNSKNKISL